MIGQEVLGYHVEELIGRGSFASVYKVRKENESGTYIRALKHITIPDQMQYQRIWNAMGKDKERTDCYFEQVFQETMQEIRLMHTFTEQGIPNIVACYENDVIHRENPRQYEIFILMEYLTSFSDYISKNDLTVEDVLNVGIQILDALAICHENNIIHRDIKEDNIFISTNGTCKLGDFGVAKILRENGLVSSMKGTTTYMAPEVLRHTEDYDKTVDLYALGMVMYRLMNHMRAPFLPKYPNGFNMQDEEIALKKRMSFEALPLPDAVPKAVGKVILKALSSRNARFQCAEDFKQELLTLKSNISPEELHRSVMTGEKCDEIHIICPSDIQKAVSTSIKRKNKKKKRMIAIIIVGIALLGSISALGYHQYYKKQYAVYQKIWREENVFPFGCISMEMKEKDLKRYYGSVISEGVDGQYYMIVEYGDTEGYATLCFEDECLKSVSYSVGIEEMTWNKIGREFYRDWSYRDEKWPHIAEKEGVQAILDYDFQKQKASLYVQRID